MRLNVIFFSMLVVGALAFSACQKSYENNTEVLTILKDIKNNDSILLRSFKGLQLQVDSLVKIANQNTVQLTQLKATLDSALQKLVNIQLQLSQTTTDVSDIKKQLSDLLQLYQSLYALISNLNCGTDILNSLKDGLLAYYAFDNSLVDSSANKYNGTSNGSFNYSLDHNLANLKSLEILNGYISLGSAPKLEFTKDQSLSVTGWVYIDNKTNGGRFISSENTEGNLRFSVWTSGNKKRIDFAFGNSGVSIDSLSSNTWYNFTYSYNSDGSKVYLNGNLVSKITQLNTEVRSYNGYRFGQKNAIAYDQFYGRLDEMRFYNRVLSDAEIKFLASH